MIKVINKLIQLMLWAFLFFVGYHSITMMYIIASNARGVFNTFCACVANFIWLTMLFVLYNLIYSITFKNKEDESN